MSVKCHGYINLYRAGWFHRKGKPNTCDVHAGDVYGTEDAALRAAEPSTHYVATVPITWEQETAPVWNPEHSTVGYTHGTGGWEE